MATIYYDNGGYAAYPLQETFSVDIRDDLSTPLKITELTLERRLIGQDGTVTNLKFNSRASAVLGIPVFGNVILCAPGELTEEMAEELVGVRITRITRVVHANTENTQLMTLSIEPKVRVSDGIRSARLGEIPQFWGVYVADHALDKAAFSKGFLHDLPTEAEAIEFANGHPRPIANNLLSFEQFKALSPEVLVYAADNGETPFTLGSFVAAYEGDLAKAFGLYQVCTEQYPDTALQESVW